MKKTIEDVSVQGKKVLVRVDFNVPMDKETGTKITDENRILGALPTIKYLLGNGAALILCSHMGKPHNVLNDKLKLNKKEKAKIEALPAEEQAAAEAAALEKAKKDITKLKLAPWDIRVNALSPAAIVGGMVRRRSEEELRERDLSKFDTPLPCQGTPEDCAELIAFLCSDAAKFITGQAVYIDGGLSAQCRPYCMGPLMLNPDNLKEQHW